MRNKKFKIILSFKLFMDKLNTFHIIKFPKNLKQDYKII